MAMIKDKIFKLKNGATLCIRNPKASDAAALIEYLKRMFGETQFTLSEPDEFTMTVEEEVALTDKRNNSECDLALVAEIDGKIVSFLNFDEERKRRISHTGYFGISVLKDYWGLGIATHMMDVLLAHARASDKIELVLLRMHSTNEKAMSIYSKLGFVEYGRIPNELKFKDGTYVDTIIMGLDVRK